MKLCPLSVLCVLLLLCHTQFSWSRRSRGSSRGGSTYTHKKNRGSSSRGGHPKQSEKNSQGGGGYNQYGVGFRGPTPFQGGYINQNPNNRNSPRFSGSYGWDGIPFSTLAHYRLRLSLFPREKPRTHGRTAMVGVAEEAMAGMALGYGLGRFPRPHFELRSSQEEYYYNYYMYRKHVLMTADANDCSRDYEYSNPAVAYDSYMDFCMNTTDLLPVNVPAATTATPVAASGPDAGRGSNRTETKNTAAGPGPPAEDDDLVSIVEIGYPALIEQLKVRRCLERWIVVPKRLPGGRRDWKWAYSGFYLKQSSIKMKTSDCSLQKHQYC
uniref:Prion protein, related sequence 3 n=1 Tax=Echeneis naucrates TaxID=173247 RepID=A0A665T3H7_ECHNA